MQADSTPGTATLPAGCVERCPGCPQRSLSQEESEARNNEWLARELEPWREQLRPIISPATRWGYRRKVLLHARRVEGDWQFGMIRMRGREEEFIPIPECPLHHPAVNRALALAAAKLKRSDLPLAYALVSGSALSLVLKSERREEVVGWLKSWEPDWQGGALWVNWNPVAGKRAIDSRRNEPIFGGEWIQEGGLWHGPSAFRQQIPELEEKALALAEDWLEGAGLKLAVDLYSGLGASLRKWRSKGWETAGVELSGESVRAAEMNAPGARILRGRTEDRLPQLKDFLAGRAFVAYSNPPRSGHGEKVLDWLLAKGPERMAYLSCHPRSLAGDLKKLSGVFAVESLQPFDFFPQTGHAETLALLNRK
jgi:23S rRNA (uracil1939-C5)-methyltransferase